jgi:phosphorylcholine metabolism protein LicD
MKHYEGWDPRIEIEKEKYKYSFYESEYIGAMTTARRKPWYNKKELWSETTELKFEDEYFSVPIGYKEHLQSRYGDYMKLPWAYSRVDEMHEFQTWQIDD